MATRRPGSAAFDVREEVLNVVLADLLSNRGLLSIPESIRRSLATRGRRLPDVTVADLWGVRIVIEGRVGESAALRASLTRSARGRVEEGICPICLAVAYPSSLRGIESLAGLRESLASSTFRVRVVYEGGELDWMETSLDGIAAQLRRSYELLVSEDVVLAAVGELDDAIEQASEILNAQPATPERVRVVLGIPEEDRPDPRAPRRLCRVAALTLANAMIFQGVLAAQDSRVTPLRVTLDDDCPPDALLATWQRILDDIDYIPIFSVAKDLLQAIQDMPGVDDVLTYIGQPAGRITARRAALRHDLMGRIYHRLIADAKYFGACYTTVPAASMLLKLTLNPEYWDGIDWAEPTDISNLRIADLACGTGTLLKATLQTAVDNHIRARAERHEEPSIESIHKEAVEHTLWGFDVIPSAIHLAASALAIHEPRVPFSNMNLFTLDLEGRRQGGIRLGTIDFILSRRIAIQADLFGAASAASRTTGAGDSATSVEMPDLDLCVMNPPFTRSVGGNLLFGNAPIRERRRMQNQLKAIVREEALEAKITAGLGSVFIALANKYVRQGGHLALVLPKGLLSGVSWEPSRLLIGRDYHVRYIIVSHEPGGWCFSENTKISECMIVAQRLRDSETAGATKVVNIWQKPKTGIEALSLARRIEETEGVPHESSTATEEIRIGERKIAELVVVPSHDIGAGRWAEAANFAQTDLGRTAYYLARGSIYIPTRGVVAALPVVELQELGQLGPDRRTIHDGFDPVIERTDYPAFWGHRPDAVRIISQSPNRYLSPLARVRRNRQSLPDASRQWSMAGRLVIAQKLRLNTLRVASACFPEPVLSNTWWPFALSEDIGLDSEHAARILALWLNSTLGIASLMSIRVETEGAWFEIRKPLLHGLHVLDPAGLSVDQRQILLTAYDALCDQELQPVPRIEDDPVRAEIDRTVMTAITVDGDLSAVRRLVAAEPLLIAR